MKNKIITKYLLFTFISAWIIQIIACVLSQKIGGAAGQGVFTLLLSVNMFMPLTGVLVTKGTLRGLGWRPDLRNGKLKYYFLAWLLPAVLTAAGAVLYFLIFPSHFDITGSYLVKESEAAGVDMMAELSAQGLDYNGYMVMISIASLAAAFINIPVSLGEEAGWRGFLNPQLKERFGIVKGLVIGGVIWGVWHFPVIIIAGYEYGKEYFGAPVLGPVVFCIVTVAWGIIADFVYEKTGCIWVPALFHGAVNAISSRPLMLIYSGLSDTVILGPLPNGLISVIPSVIAAFVMLRILAVRKGESNGISRNIQGSF